MATTRKRPSTIAQAKKAKSKFFYGKGNKKLAAVTKEDMEKAGFTSFGRQSLRKYLNQQQNKPKQTAAKVAPKVSQEKLKFETNMEETLKKLKFLQKKSPKSESKKYSDIGQRPRHHSEDVGKKEPVKKVEKKVEEKNKIRTRLKNPQKAITASQEKSKKAQEKRAEERRKTKLTPAQEAYVNTVSTVVPGVLLTKVITKWGLPIIKKIIPQIKNLSPKQQIEVVNKVNNATNKTEASKLGNISMRVFKGKQPLKKDRVEPYIPKSNEPLTPGQRRTSHIVDAAKQSQRKEIDPSYTGGHLKRGGQIKKYNKGGKVVKRKEGGQVMSGNDFVSSIYD